MKEVNMYIRGICKNTGAYVDSKEGSYICLIEYKGKYKNIAGKKIQTTSNRMLITALNDPCYINLYTPTLLGFNSLKKSPNKDMLRIVLDDILMNGHKLNEIVSNKNQDYLIKELKLL